MIFKPFIKLNKITDISPQMLQNNYIKGLILDVDNTLSTHHGKIYADGLLDWLDNMISSNVSLIILSNSKEKRVKPFAEGLNLNYISLGLKPLPFGYFKAAQKLKLKRREIAIVGDQLFTDSLGGNLSGIKPIILNPIKPEPMLSFKIRRWFEKQLYKLYKF